MRSIRILRQRDKGPYCKNMSLRTRRVLIVEADRTIGPKIISVSRLSRMQAFNSVHPTARGHLSRSIQHEINLFCHLVMVRKICATGREVHQEKIGDGVSRVEAVACGGTRPDQKLVEHGRRMTFYRLFLQFG